MRRPNECRRCVSRSPHEQPSQAAAPQPRPGLTPRRGGSSCRQDPSRHAGRSIRPGNRGEPAATSCAGTPASPTGLCSITSRTRFPTSTRRSRRTWRSSRAGLPYPNESERPHGIVRWVTLPRCRKCRSTRVADALTRPLTVDGLPVGLCWTALAPLALSYRRLGRGSRWRPRTGRASTR